MTEGIPVSDSKTYLVVKHIPEGQDPNAYKTEQVCKICGIPFKKTGPSQSQRHVCRFCIHSVCAACSPLTALHPKSNNSERICLACYTYYLKVSIDEENEPRYRESVRIEVDEFARRTRENYKENIESEKRLSKDREKDLFEEISRLSLEVQKRDTMIMTIDLSEDNSEKKEETESIAKYINEMKQIEAENNRLKLELTQLKNKPQVAPVADKEGCLKKCSIF